MARMREREREDEEDEEAEEEEEELEEEDAAAADAVEDVLDAAASSVGFQGGSDASTPAPKIGIKCR